MIVRVGKEDYESLVSMEAVHTVDYGSFVWLELTPTQFTELKASDVRYVEPSRPTVLQFQEYRFDTRFEELMVPRELRADITCGRSQLFVLQYVGPAKDVWRGAIEDHGVKFIRAHPPHAYTVWMTPEQAASTAKEEFVRWVGIYHPAFKINPILAQAAHVHDNGYRTIELRVSIYDDGQQTGTVDQTIQALHELGGELVDRRDGFPISAPIESVRIRLPMQALFETAQLEAVIGVHNTEQPAIDE